jgi:transposase-like protein
VTRHEEEARARVGALLHNNGGTYAAASRATGISPMQLANWHQGRHVPRVVNQTRLRELTSPRQEPTALRAEWPEKTLVGKSDKVAVSLEEVAEAQSRVANTISTLREKWGL